MKDIARFLKGADRHDRIRAAGRKTLTYWSNKIGMPPQPPPKKAEKGGQGKPQTKDASVKSPIHKAVIKKEEPSSADQRRDAKKGGASSEKKVNHKQKADIDDMDEIFAAKPSKSKKEDVADSSAGASASSGPDLSEIAKEAERYKGSGGPGIPKSYSDPQFEVIATGSHQLGQGLPEPSP
jgi:hypothetical protein